MNGGGSNLREKFLWLQARRKNNKLWGRGSVHSYKNSFNRLYFSLNKEAMLCIFANDAGSCICCIFRIFFCSGFDFYRVAMRAKTLYFYF